MTFTVTLVGLGKLPGKEYITRQRKGTLPLSFFQFQKIVQANVVGDSTCYEQEDSTFRSRGWVEVFYSPHDCVWVTILMELMAPEIHSGRLTKPAKKIMIA